MIHKEFFGPEDGTESIFEVFFQGFFENTSKWFKNDSKATLSSQTHYLKILRLLFVVDQQLQEEPSSRWFVAHRPQNANESIFAATVAQLA